MTGSTIVRQLGFAAVTGVALAIAASGAQSRKVALTQTSPPSTTAPGTPATPTADPYAGNAVPGTTQFPLAAPAGRDSNAKIGALPGAQNQGPSIPQPGSTDLPSTRRPAPGSGIRSS